MTENTKPVSCRLPVRLVQKVKILAALRDTTVTAIIDEALTKVVDDNKDALAPLFPEEAA